MFEAIYLSRFDGQEIIISDTVYKYDQHSI